jgi:hypothetical protein
VQEPVHAFFGVAPLPAYCLLYSPRL